MIRERSCPGTAENMNIVKNIYVFFSKKNSYLGIIKKNCNHFHATIFKAQINTGSIMSANNLFFYFFIGDRSLTALRMGHVLAFPLESHAGNISLQSENHSVSESQ